MSGNAVVIYSGGLDSTTLLYQLRDQGYEVKTLSVDYGQRHRQRESAAAAAICDRLGVERRVVNLASLVDFLGKNSLSDHSVDVPEGRYKRSSMQVTTVPNRNMILVSVGIAWAISLQYDSVAFGAHGGRYSPYPDCQPAFAQAMHQAAGLCDWKKIAVLAPFVTWHKGDIVKRAAELGVPFELTWSCYKGGKTHCGRCGTCIDRREAFTKADLVDPVEYAE
jgi:7-cyano-7-deazaguanine synthase